MPSRSPEEPAASVGQQCRTAARLLVDDRAALLVRQPFLAALAMHLPVVAVVDPRIGSATTDGRRVFVHAPFVLSLAASERRFLLAHVVWHCALLHPWRRAGRASPWWDLAIDHEVNAILQQVLPLPEGSVWYEQRSGQSAEQVHRSLTASGAARDRGRLADLHLCPERLVESRGGEAASVASAGELELPSHEPLARHPDHDLSQLWAERVLAVARQVERTGGQLPVALQRLLERLQRPQLDWRELLRQFVVSVVGDQRVWLPPSRRHLHQGLYLPSRHEPCIRLAVALDTSASTQSLLPALVGELVGIAQSYGRYQLLLVQGDARVQSVQTYSQDAPLDVDALELKGFGSTDFRPIFSFLNEHEAEPTALVFLTDGRGTAPKAPPGYPVLWVLTAEGRAPTNWGQVLRLGEGGRDQSW